MHNLPVPTLTAMSWAKRQVSLANNETWIVNVVNLLFFALVQTLFFIFVASRIESDVVKRKGEALLQLRQLISKHPCERFRHLGCFIDRAVVEARISRQAHVIREEASREESNIDLLRRWLGPVILTLTILVGLLFLRGAYGRYRSGTPIMSVVGGVGLLMVVLAYTTELLFYFGVVRRYQHIGDWQVARVLMDSSGSPVRTDVCHL